jgi:diguanylate cyclase (GGDEF)-like protein
MEFGRRSGTSEMENPATTARVLAALFFLGAASGALTLILPHSAEANESALWTNVAIPLLASGALAALANWVRPWMLQIVLAAGTVIITRAVYYGHDSGTFYSLWYVWVGLFSFFFFGRFWGLVQLALVGVTFGWVLTELPPASSVVRWLMTIVTVLIGGALVDVLAQRVRSREAAARSRARSLEIVSAAAHDLARQTTSSSVGDAICRSAIEASAARCATVWQPAGDGRALVAFASTSPEIRQQSAQFLEPGSEVVQAFVAAERRYAENDDGGCSLLEPMVLDGAAIGVLAIDWREGRERLDEEHEQVVALLALEGALSLERAQTLARLERVARTDDLTGLANRRSFDEHFSREMARAKRQSSSLAVAVLDLDHFKLYNDEHGHPAGDRLLKQVASSWEGAVRATDILARYGGEEFTLLLPGASSDEAQSTLERLRTAMPATQRVSAGLVFWDGTEDTGELLARADEALYEAKALGRDRVVLA